jgi:maltose/moltooligosaccharide transporter
MDKLNYKKTFILGFGFMAIMLYTTLYDAFVPIFLREFINKTWIIGFLITVDHYLSIFIQPLAGRLSDKTNTRFGKRMPYILIGMPLVAILVCLIPNYWSLASLLIIVILCNLVLSAFRSPMIALMPDITQPQLHSKANGAINFMGGIGAAIALSVGALLYAINHAFPFYMAAVILLISTAVLFFNIKEKRDALEYSAPSIDGPDNVTTEKIRNLNDLLAAVKNMKNALILLFSIFFLFIAFYSVSSYFTLFAKEHLQVSEALAARKFAFLPALMLIMAVPAGLIGAKIGKKKTILIGITVMMLVFGGISITTDINVIGFLFIPAGAAWALIMINAYPFVISMTDTKNIGAYTGFYYFFSSLASLVSPPLIGLLIDKIGYGILFTSSVGSFALAFIFMLFVRPQKKEPAETIQPA